MWLPGCGIPLISRSFRLIINHKSFPQQTTSIYYRSFASISRPTLAPRQFAKNVKFFSRNTQKPKQRGVKKVPDKPNDQVKTVGLGALWKPLGFTIFVCSTSFTVASIWERETFHKLRYRLNTGNNTMLNPVIEVFAIIFTYNLTVFLLWRLKNPTLKNIMKKYYTCTPATSARCLPMLLSAFSHQNPLHLFVNMYVLYNFLPILVPLMGKHEFLAFYVSAATISSFVSSVAKVMTKRTAVPSLGASGAILAMIGLACVQFPNMKLSVAFVDQIFPHSFTSSQALKGILLFDTVGLAASFSFMDHAAHLGGTLTGIFYIKYGRKWIKHYMSLVADWWDKRRGRGRPSW